VRKNNKNNDKLIDEHTLMFVAIHEMSHTCTKSVGHKSEFWENFKFLLENAKESKIHIPVDYTKSRWSIAT
jgi:predicted metal-dependent hydrolase